MPLYEYQCESCAHRFERILKFSDPPIDVCPVCGGPVRKLFSSPAIQFKGSGWYITDYAKKSPRETGKSGDPASSDSSGSSSSDSKSDTKASSDSKTTSDTKTSSDTKTTSDTKTSSDTKTDSKSGSTTKSD